MLQNRFRGAIRKLRNKFRGVPADRRGRTVRRILNLGAQRAGGTAAGMAATQGLNYVVNNRYRGRSNYTAKRANRRFASSVGAGTAWKKVKRVRAVRTAPKVGYKFKKKVQAVNDYDKPYGEYIYVSDQQISQTERDDWAEYSTDNLGNYFAQFTPYQIWDAASVLFNAKAAVPNWLFNVAQGVNGNVRYKQSLHVINSYTNFEFKSTSAHVVNIEMFICYPKSNNPSDYAINLALASKNGTNYDYAYLNESDVVTAGTYNLLTNQGTTAGMWGSLHREYKVVKVTLKFNPGEQKKHFLQGPKNMTIDGTKYTTSNNTLCLHAKFAPQVFFRVINDPTVNGIETGSTRQYNVSQWPSNIQGGVAMRQRRHIRVRLPENTDASNITTLSEERQNTIYIGRWTKRDTTDIDQQVLVQNPLGTDGINP